MSGLNTTQRTRQHAYLPAIKASAVAVGLLLASAAQATQFTFDNGVSGSFDSTLSYGLSWRAQSPDRSLIGITNGGTASSVNEDDGDRRAHV